VLIGLAAILAWIGCGSGGQTGGLAPVPQCSEVDVQLVPAGSVSPVGVSPMEALVRLADERRSTLRWESGALSTLAVQVTPRTGGEARFVSTGPEVGCPSFLAIDVDVSLVSADGTIAATGAAILEVTDAATLLLKASGLDASAVVARSDLADLGLAALADPQVVVDLDLSADGLTGEVSVRGGACPIAPDEVGSDGSEDCPVASVLVARITAG
jgi:hypothetical protein